MFAGGVGAVVAALAAVYLLAPHPAPKPAPRLATTANRVSRAVCSLVPGRSFNTPLGTPSVAFTIDPARACVNGGIAYERTPAGFSRIIPNAGADVVSTLDISADLTTLRRQDFPLSAKEAASLHAALGSAKTLRCGASDTAATLAAKRTRLAAIRSLSQPYLARKPVRQITWRCQT